MGSRRVSRKRLYEVEKQGIAIDLEAGGGIKGAIVSATQHRQGQELISEIAIDLGTSKSSIVAGGADGQAIGVTADGTSATYAFITQLTAAKFGNITEIRVVCVEDISAASNGTDIDVFAAPSAADKDQGDSISGIGSVVAVFTGGAAVVKGRDDSYTTDTLAVADHYLYITDGAGSASGAVEGKLLIYIHGFVAPADL